MIMMMKIVVEEGGCCFLVVSFSFVLFSFCLLKNEKTLLTFLNVKKKKKYNKKNNFILIFDLKS